MRLAENLCCFIFVPGYWLMLLLTSLFLVEMSARREQGAMAQNNVVKNHIKINFWSLVERFDF